MQTFLPFADFRRSAEGVDNKGLGKQRVEVWQLYCTLTRRNRGWRNHAAAKIQRSCERAG